MADWLTPQGLAPHLLVFDLHLHLNTMLSDAVGNEFQGTSQAARYLKRRGKLAPVLAKKIERLDIAYHVVRHLTAASAQAF